MNSTCVRWADLLPELLAKIHGCLQNRADLLHFRWVCRSWRISASSLPNKLSPFFPLTLPHPSIGDRDRSINASAVYLLRHRRDPQKAWMVSVQESVAGKLVLRHALTYAEIAGGNLLDLWPSDDWILTQVARSYSSNLICASCNGIQGVNKLTVIPNSCRGSLQLVGWYNTKSSVFSKKAFFVLDLSGQARKIIDWGNNFSFEFADFVNFNFNGWIYTIDLIGNLRVVDHNKSRLAQIDDLCTTRMWLVVSDGYLYMVATLDTDSFWIYRLLVKDHCDGMITRGKWRKVEDLGERVFFLAKNCSFSVSAREGNCIVYHQNSGRVRCSCDPFPGKEGSVFFIGGKSPRNRSMALLKGYSDLFDPPSHWLINQFLALHERSLIRSG